VINQFYFLLQILAPVFAVMALGYLMRKIGILSSEADRSLTRLVVTLLAPCLALDTIIGNDALRNPANWIVPPLLGFASIVVGIVISRWGAMLFGIPEGSARRTFTFTTSLQNYVYIPLPLCHALFDRAAMGILFGFYLGVELAFWSIALAQLTGHAEQGSWRKAINPPIIAIPSAIVLNALGAKEWIAPSIATTIHMLAVCAIPVALLLSGGLIADHVNKESLQHGSRTIFASAAIRIGILPTLILLFTKIAPLDVALKSVLVLQAAMPAAIFPIVVTKAHQGDMPTALQVVLGTSAIGLITIPLWIGFGMYWILPNR
jgi:malate permease and related proteins